MRLKHCFKGRPTVAEQAKQEMLGADVIVFEFASFSLRGIEGLLESGAEKQICGTGALDFMATGQLAFEVGFELGGGHADFFEQVRNEAVGLANQRQEEVFAVHFLMGVTMGDSLSFLQRLLGFNGKTFQIHSFDIGATGGSVKYGPNNETERDRARLNETERDKSETAARQKTSRLVTGL